MVEGALTRFIYIEFFEPMKPFTGRNVEREESGEWKVESRLSRETRILTLSSFHPRLSDIHFPRSTINLQPTPSMNTKNHIAKLLILSAVYSSPLAVHSAIMAQNPPAQEQVAPNKVEVPVRSVSLFSSGVGYFQHLASVKGDAQAEIIFKTDQVNDILKSLVMQDLGGGQIGTVSYPSLDPVGKTLKGFAIDLTKDPSMANLLSQVRGASVKVETVNGDNLTGTVLGVESRQVSVGSATAPIAVAVLNLVTPQGLRSVRIDETRAISLSDAKLQEELNRALAAVARARDEEKKAIRFDFAGKGDRQVKIGYVVQTPVWKTSYRLVLDDKDTKAGNLQGWAIVENQTDNDWNDISLNLVSGRPLSFTMDLYTPMYLDRPVAQLELFTGLRPQVYGEGVMGGGMAADREEAKKATARRRDMEVASPAPAMMPGAAMSLALEADSIDATASVTSRASAGQIGELFQYTVPGVTLARQSSAMIPIVTDPIEVKKLSIYNANVHASYPLTGARINNTTGKNLLQGPVTVFAGGAYAGDAQINNVPPGQSRLISYGIDLQVQVDSTKVQNNASIISGKIVKGMFEMSVMREDARTYVINNKAGDAKTVLIEAPRLASYELFETDKPGETTDNLYRFEVDVLGKTSRDLTVKQRFTYAQSLSILDVDSATLMTYTSTGTIPTKVRQSLAEVVKRKDALDAIRNGIQEIDGSFEAIAKDQDRIRENMRTIDRNTDYYKRLLTRLNEQEDQMDKGRIERDKLAKQLEEGEVAFRNYVAELNVD
jgi:Domain of unknown function (DUF4139)